MKIINNGIPEGNQIVLDEISCVYLQENDCTESSDEYQEIKISTRDGGGGKFIHIKTNGWSITDETELVELIRNFRSKYE